MNGGGRFLLRTSVTHSGLDPFEAQDFMDSVGGSQEFAAKNSGESDSGLDPMLMCMSK